MCLKYICGIENLSVFDCVDWFILGKNTSDVGKNMVTSTACLCETENEIVFIRSPAKAEILAPFIKWILRLNDTGHQ